MKAAFAHILQCVAILIVCGLAACSPSIQPETAIHDAAQAGKPAIIRRILEKHPELVNHQNPARNARKRTPLHEAATREVAEVLIRYGADIRMGDHLGWTPLHTAQDAEIAKLLIEQGADIHARAQRQFTPLHTIENPGAADVLIRHGADVNSVSANQITPIMQHIDRRSPEIVAILIRHGANLNPQRNDGKGLLHLAAERDNVEIVRMLLDRGLDVNAHDKLNATPLHYAVFKNCVPVAAALLENRANPNDQLDRNVVVHTINYPGYGQVLHSQSSVSGFNTLDLAQTDEMKVLLIKHGAQTAAATQSQPANQSVAPVPPAQTSVKTAMLTPSVTSNAPPDAKEKPAQPESLVGQSLSEVRRRLGPPKIDYKQGATTVLVYPDRKIISRDGATVYSDQRP